MRYICIYVFYLYVCLIYMCTLGKAVGSLIWGCMGQQGKQEPARRVFQKPATRAARFAGFWDAGRPAPAKPAAAASAPAARRRPPPPPAPPREPRRRPLGACRFGGFGWGGGEKTLKELGSGLWWFSTAQSDGFGSLGGKLNDGKFAPRVRGQRSEQRATHFAPIS